MQTTKEGGRIWGQGKDPTTAGIWLESLFPERFKVANNFHDMIFSGISPESWLQSTKRELRQGRLVDSTESIVAPKKWIYNQILSLVATCVISQQMKLWKHNFIIKIKPIAQK
jgi:hypothetical protein